MHKIPVIILYNKKQSIFCYLWVILLVTESGDEEFGSKIIFEETDDVSSSSEEECAAPDAARSKITIMAKDGKAWERIHESNSAPRGRAPSRNLFRGSRVTGACRGIRTEADAFSLLLDEPWMRHVRKCTEQYASTKQDGWSVGPNDFDAFIGLLYFRGAFNLQHKVDDLWNKTYGPPIFRETMSRDQFRTIKRYLRFDDRPQRRHLLAQDKFAMAREILERFVTNSQKCYLPEESLTIDEQLFPTKTRCPFTQYIPTKPDKFGIKFWILAEVNSKYCLVMKPYLGKEEQREGSLGEHVVQSLMKNYKGGGYNVTTDNFFTSVNVAKILCKDFGATLVGTVRVNRRELPIIRSQLKLHDSEFFKHDSTVLVRYQTKKKKTVLLISNQHSDAVVPIIFDGKENVKKKPEIVLYYNKNKCGVDMLDSMCRELSTKMPCRRWPVAVFFNILDMALVNSWILFKKITSSEISRRQFAINLAEQLTSARRYQQSQATIPPPSMNTRVRCQMPACKAKGPNGNKTDKLCAQCQKGCCGKCNYYVLCHFCKPM